MEIIYKSLLHNYIHINFSNKELSYVQYMIDNDDAFGNGITFVEKGNNVYFFHFNIGGKYTIPNFLDYIEIYLLKNKTLDLKLRELKLKQLSQKMGS